MKQNSGSLGASSEEKGFLFQSFSMSKIGCLWCLFLAQDGFVRQFLEVALENI